MGWKGLENGQPTSPHQSYSVIRLDEAGAGRRASEEQGCSWQEVLTVPSRQVGDCNIGNKKAPIDMKTSDTAYWTWVTSAGIFISDSSPIETELEKDFQQTSTPMFVLQKHHSCLPAFLQTMVCFRAQAILLHPIKPSQ